MTMIREEKILLLQRTSLKRRAIVAFCIMLRPLITSQTTFKRELPMLPGTIGAEFQNYGTLVVISPMLSQLRLFMSESQIALGLLQHEYPRIILQPNS